jgi:hypothetical protein
MRGNGASSVELLRAAAVSDFFSSGSLRPPRPLREAILLSIDVGPVGAGPSATQKLQPERVQSTPLYPEPSRGRTIRR